MESPSKQRKTIQFKLSLEEYQIFRHYFESLNQQDALLTQLVSENVSILDTNHNLNKPAELVLTALVKHRLRLESIHNTDDSKSCSSEKTGLTYKQKDAQELASLRLNVDILTKELAQERNQQIKVDSSSLSTALLKNKELQAACDDLQAQLNSSHAERAGISAERESLLAVIKQLQGDKQNAQKAMQNQVLQANAQKKQLIERIETAFQEKRNLIYELREARQECQGRPVEISRDYTAGTFVELACITNVRSPS